MLQIINGKLAIHALDDFQNLVEHPLLPLMKSLLRFVISILLIMENDYLAGFALITTQNSGLTIIKLG